jgi:molybdenum cofactor cytidylyltransferase
MFIGLNYSRKSPLEMGNSHSRTWASSDSPQGVEKYLLMPARLPCSIKLILPTAIVWNYLQRKPSSYDAVVIASLEPRRMFRQDDYSCHLEQTAGIILAAGGSTRFGQPKPLLDFNGKPFVRVIAENALSAGLNPVIVVTGSHVNEVKQAVDGLQVQVVNNPEWESGQSTSIRAGITSLPAKCGGAIFLLSDQPQVTVEVIRSLAEIHSRDLPSVLAPYVDDRRANPVLFDRETFGALLKLEADQGGRAIFSKFSPSYMEWADERLLMDVDTPGDYHRLLESENGV